MKSVISIVLLVTCCITFNASINDKFNTHSHCSFTVESNNYTRVVMIAPVQHGFTVTLKPVDISVEKVTTE